MNISGNKLLVLFSFLVLVFSGSCKKDKETFEGDYTLSVTTPFETRHFYAAPDHNSIYVGIDLSMPRIWHFEKSGDSYVIRPANDASKVISFNGNNRPVLLDRPSVITAKELFQVEKDFSAKGFLSIRSVYFNNYINVPMCYRNGSVSTYDIEVVKKDQCVLTDPAADVCLCISSFGYEQQ